MRVANRDPADQVERPYEAIINSVRDMAQRLAGSDLVFSPVILIPMIESYAINNQNHGGPPNWVPDLLTSVKFPFDIIINVLENMYYNELHPFVGATKTVLVNHILYVVELWLDHCVRHNQRIFGGGGTGGSDWADGGGVGEECF